MNIKIDTIKAYDDVVNVHYDVEKDVLYLTLIDELETVHQTIYEEQKDGTFIGLREDNNEVVGMKVVGWWENYVEEGDIDSLSDIEESMKLWAEKLKAKAKK